MSAFSLTLTRLKATVACDTLAYVPDRREAKPLGFISKLLTVPHLRCVLFSRGQYEILVRAWGALMTSPQVATVDQAAAALPDLLRDASVSYCESQGIADYRSVGLLEAIMIGWSPTHRRMRLFQFLSYQDYVMQDDGGQMYGPVTAFPRLAAEYAPRPVAGATADQQLIATIEACDRYFADKPDESCGARVGGEVIAVEVSQQGVSSRIIHRFPDYAVTRHAGAALVARIKRGDLDTDGLIADAVVPIGDVVDSATGKPLAA